MWVVRAVVYLHEVSEECGCSSICWVAVYDDCGSLLLWDVDVGDGVALLWGEVAGEVGYVELGVCCVLDDGFVP